MATVDLIIKLKKPEGSPPWIMPIEPYHLNCSEPDLTDIVMPAKRILEENPNTVYTGLQGFRVNVISDTEVNVIYRFDSEENKGYASSSLVSVHRMCQYITSGRDNESGINYLTMPATPGRPENENSP